MNCNIAEFNIDIKARGPHIKRLCRGYEAEFARPDIILEASDDMIAAELSRGISRSLAESVALCRAFGFALPASDAYMLHAATFTVGRRCIALMAKSGTGKSTHMLLWKQLFGDSMEIINGDKPAVRIKNGLPVAYGTPWCGKEGLSVNRGAQLTDLCILRRSTVNSTRRLEKDRAIPFLLEQVIIPPGSNNIIKVLELLDSTLAHCNVWEICCNTDLSAARLSSNTIFEVE